MRNFWTGVIVFFVILIFIWLQINVFNNIPLVGVRANMGIVLVVALSTLCGQGVGISVGITYGIFSDVLFGKAFGIYTLLYFLIGFFCGKMSRGFSKENKTALIIVTLVTTLVYEVIAYLLFSIVYEYEIEILFILKVLIFECVYNLLISRICYKLFSDLAETINKGKRSYYLL